MLENDAEIRRLIHVASLYYEKEMTQSEIAKEMNVSRPLVSKMLSRARDMGIVTITIKSPLENNELLANQVANAFGLKGALVVPEAKTDYLTHQLIITQITGLIETQLPSLRNVGIGWGYLIEALTKQLSGDYAGKRKKPGNVCPLIGSTTTANRGYNTNELVRRFAEKTGMEPHYLFAPAFPLTKEDRDHFTNTHNFAEFDKLWGALDMAILRISNFPCSPDHATAVRFGKKLSQKRAVGALLSYFYDEEGRFIEGDNDFCISIGREQLQKLPCVIGICSNNNTVPAILGALRTGLITHIVLDESKALKVVAQR